MATLGDRKDDLRFYIDRNLTNEDAYITRSILDAIDNYKKNPFRWNRKRFEFVTVAEQAYYSTFTEPNAGASIPVGDIYNIMRLRFQALGTDYPYPMTRLQGEVLDVYTNATSSDRPYAWDWEAQEVILWPQPSVSGSTVKGVCIRNVSDLTTSSADGDGANDPWLNEGWEMIKNMALFHLFWEWLGNMQKAAAYKARSEERFREFVSEYESLYSSDKNIKPWYGPDINRDHQWRF